MQCFCSDSTTVTDCKKTNTAVITGNNPRKSYRVSRDKLLRNSWSILTSSGIFFALGARLCRRLIQKEKIKILVQCKTFIKTEDLVQAEHYGVYSNVILFRVIFKQYEAFLKSSLCDCFKPPMTWCNAN